MLQTYEIDVKAPKSVIKSGLMDPFLFSGVMGHVNILQVLDKTTGQYVAPGRLTSPERDYRVLYIFGTPDTKLHVILGHMSGPNLSGGAIVYTGKSDDGKFEWRTEFMVEDSASGSKIRIGLDVTYKSSALDKLMGKNPFQLAEHFIQDHILPYLKLYLEKEQVVAPEPQGLPMTEVGRVEGEISEIATKIRQLMTNMKTGAIVIKGKNLRASIQVKDGKPSHMKMIRGNQVITGNDVLANLILESGQAVAVALEVDMERILDYSTEYALKNVETIKDVKNTEY
ncbi:hypothetical protein [Metallosphaera sedula]|uniref:hypothetical protein n=1 Tax=Metallosphaera sedula TaxID=43687 RepID=UPI0020BE8BB5|nr:hypothetical protein [Metallosphaera sedula]BBL47555.1 hypothetical protein MJ1HA_1656 [Metallosphaera sedula]